MCVYTHADTLQRYIPNSKLLHPTQSDMNECDLLRKKFTWVP